MGVGHVRPYRRIAAGLLLWTLLLLASGCAVRSGAEPAWVARRASPVTDVHLRHINQRFRTGGIAGGFVIRDAKGRAELQGVYENEQEVDRAFSIAQTVVGIAWVSPITPERIRVRTWAECFSRLLSGEPCGPSHVAPAAPLRPSDERPPGPVANKYALVVGVGKFKNRIQPLQYANKDAFEVYRYLIDPQGGNFKKENVILLRDEYATREAVNRALDEIKRRAQEDDLVFLYFSSHGTPPDKFGGVHVVTYDTEVSPRVRVWETSLTEGMLREFVQQVKAKRLIISLDACYSNGAYSRIAGFLPSGGKSLAAGWDEGYGRSRVGMAQRLFGAKDLLVEEATSPPAASPAHVPNGWGTVLISASDEGERSWESDWLRNSIFSYYFIEGLRRYRGVVKEAFEYANPLVKRQVKQEKGADINQNPQLTPSRRGWNLSIAVSGR